MAAPGFRPEIWRDSFKDFFAQQEGVIDYFERYDGLAQAAGRGETIKLPALTLPASAAITPGSTFAGQTVTDAGETLVIDKFRGHSIRINPLDKQFNHADYRNALMREAARQIKNDTNSQALALATDAAVTQAVNTSGGALTDAVILKAQETLDNAEFPAEDRYLIVSPEGWSDLASITTYTSSDFNPNNGEQNQRRVAWARGFRLVMVPAARFTKITTKFAYMAFHKSAIAAAVAEPHLEQAYIGGAFIDALDIGAIWGQKIVKASGIVQVQR